MANKFVRKSAPAEMVPRREVAMLSNKLEHEKLILFNILRVIKLLLGAYFKNKFQYNKKLALSPSHCPLTWKIEMTYNFFFRWLALQTNKDPAAAPKMHRDDSLKHSNPFLVDLCLTRDKV